MSKKAVFGTGYIGHPNFILPVHRHGVVALDIDSAAVKLIDQRYSSTADCEISDHLAHKPLCQRVMSDKQVAYSDEFALSPCPSTATSHQSRRYLLSRGGGARSNDVAVLLTDKTAGEAIRLLADTFLAMRVAYFKEIFATRLCMRSIWQGLSGRAVFSPYSF
ncbi:UDP-glucose 6-dehydrogenase family protein [Pseudomonas sp. Marseille-QA0892]